MKHRRFAWDVPKANNNRRKHHVTFDEAETVWDDPNTHVDYDLKHSIVEDRWRMIGLSNRLRLLSVIYTKADEETIRIISARRADQAEALRYTGEE